MFELAGKVRDPKHFNSICDIQIKAGRPGESVSDFE